MASHVSAQLCNHAQSLLSASSAQHGDGHHSIFSIQSSVYPSVLLLERPPFGGKSTILQQVADTLTRRCNIAQVISVSCGGNSINSVNITQPSTSVGDAEACRRPPGDALQTQASPAEARTVGVAVEQDAGMGETETYAADDEPDLPFCRRHKAAGFGEADVRRSLFKHFPAVIDACTKLHLLMAQSSDCAPRATEASPATNAQCAALLIDDLDMCYQHVDEPAAIDDGVSGHGHRQSGDPRSVSRPLTSADAALHLLLSFATCDACWRSCSQGRFVRPPVLVIAAASYGPGVPRWVALPPYPIVMTVPRADSEAHTAASASAQPIATSTSFIASVDPIKAQLEGSSGGGDTSSALTSGKSANSILETLSLRSVIRQMLNPQQRVQVHTWLKLPRVVAAPAPSIDTIGLHHAGSAGAAADGLPQPQPGDVSADAHTNTTGSATSTSTGLDSGVASSAPPAAAVTAVVSPRHSWSGIAGYTALKQRLDEAVVMPVLASSATADPRIGSGTPEFSHLSEQRDLAVLATTMARLRVGPPSGVLLHGPTGCGKTQLASAIAQAGRMAFLHVQCPQLLSKYVGDSEAGVRAVFQAARKLSPCCLLLDDVDTIAGVRAGLAVQARGTETTPAELGDSTSATSPEKGDTDDQAGGSVDTNAAAIAGGGADGGTVSVLDRVLATLLNEMDGVGHRVVTPASSSSSAAAAEGAEPTQPVVLVIGTTNRESALDAALLRPGRLELHVRVGLPDSSDRLAILQASAAHLAVDEDTLGRLPRLAAATDGCSCAQLSHLLSEAGFIALTEGAVRVSWQHVTASAAQLSVSLPQS